MNPKEQVIGGRAMLYSGSELSVYSSNSVDFPETDFEELNSSGGIRRGQSFLFCCYKFSHRANQSRQEKHLKGPENARWEVEILRFLHAFDEEFGIVTSSWLFLKTPGVKLSSGWSGEVMTKGLWNREFVFNAPQREEHIIM